MKETTMENMNVTAAKAREIASNEGLPYPIREGGAYLLKTGAKITKHRGRYKIGGYHFAGQDLDPYRG
jgi:hypothetical protein